MKSAFVLLFAMLMLTAPFVRAESDLEVNNSLLKLSCFVRFVV
jgi:hypothetical protein